MEDTYNLIGSAVRKLLGATARHRGKKPAELAAELVLVLTDPTDPRSLKGRAEIEWERPEERRAFLTRVVEEARRLLATTADDQKVDAATREAAALLRRILVQDLQVVKREEDASGSPPPSAGVLDPGNEVEIRRGVAPDRIVSAGDPEMRCGHKSHDRTWNGYKLHAAVECASEFITGVLVSDAHCYDGDAAPQLLAAQRPLGLCPNALVGDHAYSKPEVRLAVAALGSEMVARVPAAPRLGGCFSKDVFTIDLDALSVTCPAGVVTTRFRRNQAERAFWFAGAVCAMCALRTNCTSKKPEAMIETGVGRTLTLHAHEDVLQHARAEQSSPRLRPIFHQRPTIERALAHLVRLGLRQARYKGRAKVEFQAFTTALVANLRRLGATLAPSPRYPLGRENAFAY